MMCVLTMPMLMAAGPRDDLAARFGAMETVSQISLSPDGTHVAYVSPRAGEANVVFTVDLATKDPKVALAADGKPLRIQGCNWVSNTRLLCGIMARQKRGMDLVTSSRLIGVNADGTGVKLVSQRAGENAHYYVGYGGAVVDWLPEEDGSVLMERYFVPEGKIGSLVEKRAEGLGIERINTLTLAKSTVEPARRGGEEYISDGRGVVRIMGIRNQTIDGYMKPTVNYSYRKVGSREWNTLGPYDSSSREGFNPLAVDRAKNIVYGLKKRDGRLALYSIALDGSGHETLVFEHPHVDVDNVVKIGRDRRVVGVTFAEAKRQVRYFDADIASMSTALSKALPQLPQTQIVDSSLDGNTLLLWAGSDVDPGQYFVFDRRDKRLTKILLTRPELEGTVLARVKAVTYRATDGTMVPAYLTVPTANTGRALPAIVIPHGGPGARDEWGFDWLAQYYVAKGFAVLQPNFRGSAGYGDDWLKTNGFKSWRIAIGDVTDAGHWLVAEGIADPKKLAILGWSYGGYAALQSAVIAPDLFKAVIAIAPVTDFNMTAEQSRGYTDLYLTKDYFGSGSHMREGSPAQQAAAIKAPVLLFHGDMDQNVKVEQSELMADQLKDAAKPYLLVVYPGLAHSLDSSIARTDMLARSAEFLTTHMGL